MRPGQAESEKSDCIESVLPKEVTTSASGVGVPQECLPVAEGRRVAFTDARLVNLVSRWIDFPEAIRDQILAVGQLSESRDGLRPQHV